MVKGLGKLVGFEGWLAQGLDEAFVGEGVLGLESGGLLDRELRLDEGEGLEGFKCLSSFVGGDFKVIEGGDGEIGAITLEVRL